LLDAASAAAGVGPWLRLVVSAGPAAGRRFETCNQAQEVRVHTVLVYSVRVSLSCC
jgi:hypothetical protein